MPQMAPINWLSLYILFTLIFVISIIMIYYLFLYTPKFTKNSSIKSLTSWKW